MKTGKQSEKEMKIEKLWLMTDRIDDKAKEPLLLLFSEVKEHKICASTFSGHCFMAYFTGPRGTRLLYP